MSEQERNVQTDENGVPYLQAGDGQWYPASEFEEPSAEELFAALADDPEGRLNVLRSVRGGLNLDDHGERMRYYAAQLEAMEPPSRTAAWDEFVTADDPPSHAG